MSRTTEFIVVLMAMIVLLPLFFIISLLIVFDSKGGILYKQTRVGKDNRDFRIYKFRSMRRDAEQHGLLSRGRNDQRVTRSGHIIRRFKMDELPQLFNILKGDMSIVGPRPEVRKYVDLYSPEQQRVLSVRPGLTDDASLRYIDEGELLAGAEDPERMYIQEIMPAKLALNLKYIDEKSTGRDLQIILKTIRRIFSSG